jgi:hypothetical protein
MPDDEMSGFASNSWIGSLDTPACRSRALGSGERERRRKKAVCQEHDERNAATVMADGERNRRKGEKKRRRRRRREKEMNKRRAANTCPSSFWDILRKSGFLLGGRE